jgi:hypothetical protein
MVAISQASGGSSTVFALTLPNAAACSVPSNKPGGDLLDSFVVDNAKVSASEVGNLTFGGASLPAANGYTGANLTESGGTHYVNVLTEPVTGQVPSVGNLSWQFYVNLQDFGQNAASGADLYPGTFNIGVACVTPAGKIDGSEFWNVQITFAASNTDPGGFTWALAPFATSVKLSASPSGQAAPGASVTLTATISPSTAPGTVTFYNHSTVLGTDPVVVNSGVATSTLVTGSLPVGTDSLSATYTPLQYNVDGVQSADVYGPSTSAAMPYVISTASTTSTTAPANGTTTTTVAGGSTTTTAGGSGSGGTGSSGGSSGSGTGGAGSSSEGTGTGGSNSGSGSSTGSGSSDPPLAATGEPIFKEVFLAVLIAVAGLFVLSFAVPTVGRGRTR